MGAGSMEKRQGIPGGCCAFAEVKDGRADQDRKEESGQVRLGHVLTSQLWPWNLVRTSNSRSSSM